MLDWAGHICGMTDVGQFGGFPVSLVSLHVRTNGGCLAAVASCLNSALLFDQPEKELQNATRRVI
jgi:hypothetical protein